ncbi:MAG: serine hydrolase [Chloroflexota bacterium]
MRKRRGAIASRPSGERKLPPATKLIAYGLLIFFAARVFLMAWDAVQLKRAELHGEKAEVVDLPFQRLPVLKSGQDEWIDTSLTIAIESAISPAIGTPGVYVKSLNNGASATIGDDRVFPTASLFKVPILVELLRQQSLGMHDMDTKIQLQQKHWAEGAGVLQARIGEELTVRELAELMIAVSDNVAALALLDLVGTDNVNLTLQANGLEKTRLRIGETSRDWGGQPWENTTTAREMGLLLEKIATGKLLNEDASKEALELLSQKQRVAWLPAMLPPDVKVAHKSGELVGLRNDAGIVYAPRSQFVVVALTSDLADHEEAAQSIARIAKAAYDYFELGRK